MSNIQDYFEYIFKKYGEKTNNNIHKYNPNSIRIYINKIENRFTFKIKTGYNFELKLLTHETIKLLENTKSKITKDENGESVSYLDITDAVLTHCNVVNNSYQQNSRVLYTFVPNKSFDQLLNISSKSFIFLKNFDLEFSYIKVWFTDQNSNPLARENKINITLVIN